MAEKFWDNNLIRNHLRTWRALRRDNPRASSDYWGKHLHVPVTKLIGATIHKLDPKRKEDDDLKAEIYAEIFTLCISKVEIDKDVNLISYLGLTVRSKWVNFISGAGSNQRSAATCFDSKIIKTRSVTCNYSDVVMEAGDRIYTNFKTGVHSVNRFHNRFISLPVDGDVHDTSPRRLHLLDHVDWDMLADYVEDCDGVDRHKDIATEIIRIVRDIAAGELDVGSSPSKKVWAFRVELKARRPEITLTQLDVDLSVHICTQCLGYYLEEYGYAPPQLFGFFGLIPPPLRTALP